MTTLTVKELNELARLCIAEGSDKGKEIAKEALRRAAERSDR